MDAEYTVDCLVDEKYKPEIYDWIDEFNTLRTGTFKLFKCTFPGSKQFKSTFILCFC